MVTRKVASHRIILSDGTCLPMTIVELDANGKVVATRPLVKEEAGVEFYPGEYRVN